MPEAHIDEAAHGRMPADDGWFILNLAEIGWSTVAGNGIWCTFESPAARSPDHAIHYPVDPTAAAHGASVSTPTDSPDEAYAHRPPSGPAPSPWPPA